MKTKWFVILLMCSVAGATPVQYRSTVDAWAAVAQNAVREGSETTINQWDSAFLYIDIALTGETAHTGTQVEVQTSATTTGDRAWSTFTTFIGPTGTPNDVMMTASITSSTTTIYCSDTSGDFDADGIRWIFIQGSTTIADSSIVLLTAHGANASLTIMEGAGLAHTTNTRMFDIADRYVIELPNVASRARVIYDNTYDSNGASITSHCLIVGEKQ